MNSTHLTVLRDAGPNGLPQSPTTWGWAREVTLSRRTPFTHHTRGLLDRHGAYSPISMQGFVGA